MEAKKPKTIRILIACKDKENVPPATSFSTPFCVRERTIPHAPVRPGAVSRTRFVNTHGVATILLPASARTLFPANQ
jgi:hypothetical protein